MINEPWLTHDFKAANMASPHENGTFLREEHRGAVAGGPVRRELGVVQGSWRKRPPWQIVL